MKNLALKVFLTLSVLSFVLNSHARIYNVLDYGAKGDKVTVNTSAIKAAVTACNESGGGTVYFPAGDYLSGTIRLLDNVRIYLDHGATIWACRIPAEYEPTTLIYARDAENIAVEGPGTLYGLGEEDLGRRPEVEFIRPEFRVGTMQIFNCRNISIRDIKILLSDSWTINLRDCDDVMIDGVTIRNNYFHTNSDGIDPVSCRNVTISNCNITAGDDCIVLKSNGSRACENVVVTNCVLESIAAAMKLGTESPNDFRDIHFSNCVVRNSTVCIGIFLKDGGSIERVSFSNITVENCTNEVSTRLIEQISPITIDIEKRHEDSPIGRISDLTFNNINIYSGFGVIIQGMPESPIENVTIRDINFRVFKPSKYTDRKKMVGGSRTNRDERDTLYVRKPSYVTVAHINGLTAENIRVYSSKEDFSRYERSAFAAFETKNGVIQNVFRNHAGTKAAIPVISLHNCENMLVTGCNALPDTPVVVGISGPKAANISIESTGMEKASKVYDVKGSPEGVVNISFRNRL